ncbi:hypothetical protein SteCoe_24831 [Stentor coeruleus]|uniref:t-SNARE coiled-coil homology domain-containing protein n=1 Tax=Stentor coeruleus TaxID=5963 RepID=A0A1R2BH23_9CILI|nr:hypothetical protein SteCoe_24831 [Stentor coeruleus]
MKNDIETRINKEVDQNSKNLSNSTKALQEKLNKFIVELEKIEQELESSNLKGYDLEKAKSELSKIKNKIPIFQSKIFYEPISSKTKTSLKISNSSNAKTQNSPNYDDADNNDDKVLQTLAFLKEISNQMLRELESQNKKIESSLQGVETSKTLIEKSQNHMSCIEKTIDYLPNSCLISSMITLALIIFILTSVL